MKLARQNSFLLLLIALSLSIGSSFGQWKTQSIVLNPGWNAVFLEVQPSPDDCDAIFAGMPVESVWSSTRRFSSVQFIQDPNALIAGGPDWLTFIPADQPGRSVQNLFTLQGGKPYLIKLKPGAGPVTWNVTGAPVNRRIDWVPNALNFVGFAVRADAAPTFQNFFAGGRAHAGQQMLRLSAAGQWQPVSNPAGTTMKAGEAYWIYSNGASTFAGPAEINLEQRDGLIYGQVLAEQTVRLKNNAATARTFTVQETASANPPSTTMPLLAGRVPLSYFKVDAANIQIGWSVLSSALSKTLQPGEEWVLRLAVNRPRMENFNPPAQHNGVLYQSILEVTTDSGVRFHVPVSSEGLRSFASTGGQLRARSASNSPHPFAGLWTGNAFVEGVSQPSNIVTPDAPLPVGNPLQLRLIVHVDNNGNVRLLRKVLEMYKNGTLIPDPADPGRQIVGQPGRYVLVTDDSLVPNFTGSALRDGEPVAKRLSSAAFGFKQPILMTAQGDFGAGKIGCTIALDYDDPVNPFQHRYHPDHDNLDERFQTKIPAGKESFNITRQLELEFTTDDPDKLSSAGWGDNQVGGNYRESITGLHNKTLFISGTFRISRVSRIGVLNDAQ